MIGYEQSSCCDMTNMNGKKHRAEVVQATKGHLDRFHSCLTILSITYPFHGDQVLHEKKTFPFVLCVSLMTLFMTTRGEMFEGAPEENQQRIK